MNGFSPSIKMFEDKDLLKFNKMLGKEDSMHLLDSSDSMKIEPKRLSKETEKTRNSVNFIKVKNNNFELKKGGSFEYKTDPKQVERDLIEAIKEQKEEELKPKMRFQEKEENIFLENEKILNLDNDSLELDKSFFKKQKRTRNQIEEISKEEYYFP